MQVKLKINSGEILYMKKERIFEGVATAIVTPFSDGEVDYEAFSELLDFQVRGGASAIVVSGTTGESATLRSTERARLFAVAKERTEGRCRLIFGTGTNDTDEAILRTREAEKIGCDGVLVVTPYYNKGTSEGLYKHYEKIAKCTNLPIILYNVPTRTGVNLDLNIIERLSKIENIRGIKEASDSQDRLISLAAFGDELPLYAGNDSALFTVLSLGGAGVISVVSNILPGRIKKITADYFGGDFRGALKGQTELLPFIRAMFSETNPAPIKYAMSLVGLCSGELRLPLDLPSERTQELICREMRALGIYA